MVGCGTRWLGDVPVVQVPIEWKSRATDEARSRARVNVSATAAMTVRRRMTRTMVAHSRIGQKTHDDHRRIECCQATKKSTASAETEVGSEESRAHMSLHRHGEVR